MICPICGNQTEELESYLPKFFLCSVCGGSFHKSAESLIYEGEYFKQNEKPSILSKFSAPLLDFFYFLRIKRIQKLLRGKKNPKVLDYGCGAGKLVGRLINNSINAVGFEPSKGARQITQKENLPVYEEISLLLGGCDLVMFWQSLEHTAAPLEIINTIGGYLNYKGKVLIAIPNANSFEARISKEKWFHYTYPLHQIQFTPKSAKMMLAAAGFKIKKIDFFNPEYTISGLAQTFLNFFLPKDALYSVIAHRRQTMPLSKAILISLLSIIFLVIFSPLLILFFLIQLILRKTGAMVIVAEKI